MDMVCDKVAGHEIDFLNDPIETYIDGEWLRAKGTTLGADDGIGCAIELAILDADDIEHGPIECLFTVDEETGLTGANNLSKDMLKSKMLLNLDSEDEGLFYVSCAGGKTTSATFIYNKVEAPKGMFFLSASIKGLTGGHSGDDINKKRANAIKILARFLYLEQQKHDICLAQFNSGKLHNAIPREGEIVFAVPFADKEQTRADWNIFCSEVEEEFMVTEKNMHFHMESADAEPVIPQETGKRIINALQAVHHGVFSVVQDLSLGNLTETSSNLAVVKTEDDRITINTSQRSNVMSNLENMVNTVTAVFELAGADSIIHNDGYPAWKMNPDSKLREVAKRCYEQLFDAEPTIIGIHAGLECGLFSERYPQLDMLSIGPTMRGVHSPDEKLNIPSVEKVYKLVKEILKNI
jgi:dipeptidase D